MKRRIFIKGAIAAAVSAALPGGDKFYGTANSDINQLSYVHKTFKVAYPEGTRYAAALARSMMQTKEQVTANVLTRAFSGMTGIKPLADEYVGLNYSGEGARRSIGVEGSPDRI